MPIQEINERTISRPNNSLGHIAATQITEKKKKKKAATQGHTNASIRQRYWYQLTAGTLRNALMKDLAAS